jgi:hypothetical protein
MLAAVGNFGYGAFLAGEWDAGLEVLTPILPESMSARDQLLMLNNYLILKASRGEDVSGGIVDITEVSRDLDGPDRTASIADVKANFAMASGELNKAHDEFMLITAEPSYAPEYVYRAAHPALWMHDLESARTLLARLEENAGSGPAAIARRTTVQAGVAALEGRVAEAKALYADALRGWRDTNGVWDEALTGLDMAELMDATDPDVAEVLTSTRQILERLGAKPYLARLDKKTAQADRAATQEGRAPTASLEVAANS